jgi:dihydroorotate dehydrogenase
MSAVTSAGRFRASANRRACFVADPFIFVKPFLHRLDPETAHEWTLRALRAGIVPGQPSGDDPVLAVELLGTQLSSPIGLAAGFDKNARVFDRMFYHGFSFVEVGGVTPLAQTGNPRPRVFRLPADGAVINRMGFPNDGAAAVEARVRAARTTGMLGINLASNAVCDDPVEDFASLVTRFAGLADYLTLDISCPNTENGQVFLQPDRLRDLLVRLNAIAFAGGRPRLLAKVSPDVDGARLEALVGVLLDGKIDGIIVSNTTSARPPLHSQAGSERGGLSGRPLFASSTAMLEHVARFTQGRIPLIGVGGVASGADAYAKIRAGATAVQLYTSLIYAGTALVTRIKRDLAELLRRDGFASIAAATGAR